MPEVISHQELDSTVIFVLSELQGTPAHLVPPSQREQTLDVIANTLKQIQEIAVEESHFLTSPYDELAIIEDFIEYSKVDKAAFEKDNGLSPEAGLEKLLCMVNDLSVPLDCSLSHGDFCLPNIIINENGTLAGVIDWALARRSSKFRDCTILEQSISRNFGEPFIQHFYDCFGEQPDPHSRSFYHLLDQFFEHQHR